jgi:hypothetical protein
MSTSTAIDIPFASADALHLHLAVGACRLLARPGDGPQWVAGSYDDPSNAVPMRITQENGTARLSQSFTWPGTWGSITQPPTFDLALGKGRPYALTVEGGAGDVVMDLGGLALSSLNVKFGAGKFELDFPAPNPHPMEQLTISTGAAGIFLKNLANANCTQITVEGGAASYELDFGGTLLRNTSVRINAAMSGVAVRVPATTAVKVVGDSVIGGLDVGDGFMKQEGAFWNMAALNGGQPLLSISASIVMGGVEIVQF